MRRTFPTAPAAARNARASRCRLHEAAFAVTESSVGRVSFRPGKPKGIAAQHGNVAVTALAILVPIAALLLVLHPALNRLIDQNPRDHLVQQAESIGAQTAERLSTADHLLRIISTDVAQADTLDTISTSTRLDAFNNLALLLDGGQSIVIKGNAPSLETLKASTTAHLSNGRTALITTASEESAKPALLREVQLATGGHPSLLFGELSSEYLWTYPRAANADYSLCISDASRRLVYCEETPSRMSGQRPPAEEGMTSFAANGVPPGGWMAATSHVDLTRPFAADDWTVSVYAKDPPPFLSSRVSTLVFSLSGMALSLGVAWRLRRRRRETPGTAPLKSPPAQRQDATIAANPGTAHGGNSNDKTDINDGAIRALRLFSDIDRAILSGANFDRIVESILNRIHTILPCDAAALALLDREKPSLCKMTLFEADNGRLEFPLEQALDARSTGILASIPDGDWFSCTDEDALLAPLHHSGMSKCLLVPVFRDGVPAGALVLATRGTSGLAKHEHELARDIAHRLGVAYTTTTRGQELHFHSMYDSTTELPNRKFFENRLEEEISRARRESRPLALLLVDLDKFKEVNDSYGHEAGDVLLEQASARLKTCLRSEDLVARIGSDEFAVLLPSVSQGRDIYSVAQKLIDTLSESYLIQGRGHHLSASIGLAVFPKDGKSGRALLSGADFAMHAAKRRGGASFSAYEVQSNEQAQDRTALTNDLRQAIAKRELVLYFQPQIDLKRGEIVGVEALVRWQHPTRGLVMPAEFISIAEQSDLIEHIGDFVRREASRQFRAWESDGIAPMRISINVSSRELRSTDFLEKIESTLSTSGLRPFSLELEITESLLVEQSDQVVSVLKALSERGVRIALDDFGTGYSSMAYLKKIPFHVLKIDRLFVSDIGTEDGSDSIVHAIIGVAQGLGKEIVSEGIETEEQRAFLAENGCDLAQGFFWSPPIPADEFAAFIREWNDTARQATVN